MPSEFLMRPSVHPGARQRIDRLRERAKTTSGDLHRLESMEGFAEWLSHPITLELLARVENRREVWRDEVDTMMPCASCKKDRDDVDKEHRGWLTGCAEGMDDVARTILGGQEPRCDHEG